jgi:hypothetical protein
VLEPGADADVVLVDVGATRLLAAEETSWASRPAGC